MVVVAVFLLVHHMCFQTCLYRIGTLRYICDSSLSCVVGVHLSFECVYTVLHDFGCLGIVVCDGFRTCVQTLPTAS